MRPHVSETECVGFSKARRSWEPGSSFTTGKFSPFRTLRKASAVHVCWTGHESYLSFSQKSLSWYFLALAKLRSTAQVGIIKDTHFVNKGWLLLVRWQISWSRSKAIVRTFLATNASQRDLQPAWSRPFKVLLLLRKVVRFQNFLRTWLPRRPSLVGADTSTKTGRF